MHDKTYTDTAGRDREEGTIENLNRTIDKCYVDHTEQVRKTDRKNCALGLEERTKIFERVSPLVEIPRTMVLEPQAERVSIERFQSGYPDSEKA